MTTKIELQKALYSLEDEKRRLESIRAVVGGTTQIGFVITTGSNSKGLELTRAKLNGYYTYELDKAYDLVVKGFREGTEALIKQADDNIAIVKKKIIACLEEEIKALR